MFFTYRKQLLFLLLFIPLCGLLKKACAKPTTSNFRQYTMEEGLSSNYIKHLTIDSKGFLWVGTLEGINRFDSTSFRNLLGANDFTTRAMETMAQLNDSVMLIGTHSGLVVFNLTQNPFQNHLFRDTLLKSGSKNVMRGLVELGLFGRLKNKFLGFVIKQSIGIKPQAENKKRIAWIGLGLVLLGGGIFLLSPNYGTLLLLFLCVIAGLVLGIISKFSKKDKTDKPATPS